MRNDANADILVFHPSPWRWMMLFIGSVVFVLIGLAMRDEKPLLGWSSITFFGGCGVASLIQLIPGAGLLRLEPGGFNMRVLFRDRFIPWGDVQGFFILTIRTRHNNHRSVGFNYIPGSGVQGKRHVFSQMLTGADDCLRDTYGHDVNELAALMERWRRKCSDAIEQS